MRLTLRTLLAYLDEILDPQDADQLRKKIEESEFATSLVHQVRGSVRRLRLDAPALDAQGIGGDLNSVAEYLDNTLPPEQVPTLEKACLENEVHLGEVASSHQILTLVLGQAAEVTDGMRQRCYAISPTLPPTENQRDQPLGSIPTPPATQVAPAATPTAPVEEPKPYSSAPPPTTASTMASTTSPPTPVKSAPSARPRRPSERFTAPEDVPSTKEAWRAEAKQKSLSTGATTAAAPPDYLRPRRSSLLRNLVVSAVVTFLIVAALFVAAGPLDGNHIVARWLGVQAAPVAGPEVVEERPAAPEERSIDAVEIEQVDSTQRPSPWVHGDTGAGFDPVAEDMPEQLPLGSSLTVQDSLPDLPPGDVSEPILSPTDDAQSNTGEVDSTSLAPPLGLAQPENDQLLDPLPLETLDPVDTTDLADDRDQNTVMRIGTDTAPEVTEVTPALPPKDDRSPEVPREESGAGHVANVPRDDDRLPEANVVDDLTIDPGLNLVPDPIHPPVASPAATTSFETDDAHATSDVVPDAPPVVDPSDTPSFEPTKLVQDDQLVLVLDQQTQDWQRIDAAVPLAAGDVLLGMPAFRTELEIGAAVSCTLLGAVRMQLGPESDISLDTGRLLVAMKEPNQWQGIRIGDKRLEISTPAASGAVAIEASQMHVPGVDAEQERAHTVRRIFALRNDVTVRYRGQSIEVPRGEQWIQVDDYDPRTQATSAKPRWASTSSLSRADANAVRYWKRDLKQADSIRIWLQERANNRRYNERALAARCLAEMDQFDAIVAALNDSEQHPFWDEHFETLQRALARGPETAAKVRFELEKVHGEEAGQLFEMLRGYDEKQLAEGAAGLLVDSLDHPLLDHRVLAFQNLWRIAGFTQAYNPEKPVGLRRRPVASWRGKLRSGRITYAKPPEIVALLESFAAAE